MHRKCQGESAIQGKSTLANPDDAEEEDDILLDDARMSYMEDYIARRGIGVRRNALLAEHMRGMFKAVQVMRELRKTEGEWAHKHLREFRSEVERFYNVRGLDLVGPVG
ncbi:hypothetical protein QC764_0001220 [Podospora pseudoanserina]|uniref:Uncharacterized protein n=1 Tax=Podospora pseudoanserina TaxID=2609844 RepID=A0ABR0ILM0_9PEZI|nr:hypothetical protein QC764_0001220 [Podospora pseudoanserina]